MADITVHAAGAGRSRNPAVAETPRPSGRAASLRRVAPLAALLVGALAAAVFARDYLSFEALATNREALLEWRDSNYFTAIAVYALVYAVMVAFSAPGAVWMTIGGGFLFGVVAATPTVVVAATVGATAIFLAAKHGLGDMLREKARGWLRRFEDGVRDNDVSFMLVLRLVPAVPFFIANLVPAFLGVRTRTYIWTTLVGIIPGAAVYASVGAGLGEVFEAGETPDLGVIFEPHVFLPLLGLAALAALPTAYKLIKKQRADG
jgi:uncharacterized membrane protein YdjX (TVP38/TMEM64 family)